MEKLESNARFLEMEKEKILSVLTPAMAGQNKTDFEDNRIFTQQYGRELSENDHDLADKHDRLTYFQDKLVRSCKLLVGLRSNFPV